MKLYLLSVLVAAVVLSCSGTNGSEISGKSIEGTYVLQSKSEFSAAEDTLKIKAIEDQKDLYDIERSVGYSRNTGKGDQPKETKHEKATAVWDTRENKLKEQKHGRIYSLSEDGDRLQIGSSFYTKITGH